MDLTPLHAFVGPNDSGKSTILRGIRTVLHSATSQFRFGPFGELLPFDPLFDTLGSPSNRNVTSAHGQVACGVEGGWYGIAKKGDAILDQLGNEGADLGSPPMQEKVRNGWNSPSELLQQVERTRPFLTKNLSGVRLLRLDPDAMRAASPPALEPVDYLDDRGTGLAGVYQAILGRGDEASDQLRHSIRQLFPGIKRIGVKTKIFGSTTKLTLEAELTNGSQIETPAMSEGLLYFLAFSLIPYLSPVSVLLIEEPENGLHPARIQEVIRSLRAFVEKTGTQVLMATHSPLVINELQPDEVSVVTKASVAEGTKVTRIKDTPNFAKRSSVYGLGELWLAYADGNVEAPLFEAGVP